MSKELLENFALLAASEGGVAKLRELILGLAVRGKLVAQDPKDEPASVLLNKIRAEKEQLISERQIRRGKLSEVVPEDEVPHDLPERWEWTYLGNIGDWGAGATPSRSNASYYGGTIPWFKSGELTADYISNSEEFVTNLALKECSLRPNKPGDVLVAMYGATIGKTSILTVPATTNQAVCACTPFLGFDSRYLLLLLKALKPYFISQGAGGAQPNISREKIIATVVGLPPTAEQSRIVAKVEALMALCDRLEAKQGEAARVQTHWTQASLDQLAESGDADEFARNWQALAEHFDTLFATPASIDALDATLLQLAVRGKLVPQNPADEPARELLKKIRAEKDRLIAEGKIKRDKPLPPIADDEKPFEIPEGWEWERLANLAQFIDYRGRTPNKQDSGVPLITAKNVRKGYISREPREYISEIDYPSWMTRGYPKRGDILFTTEAPLGNVAIVDIEESFALAQRVICFGIYEPEMSLALKNTLLSEYFQDAIADQASGVTAQGIKSARLQLIPIPVPPLSEQRRIGAKMDELLALTRTLRTRLTDARAVQARLASALVDEVAA